MISSCIGAECGHSRVWTYMLHGYKVYGYTIKCGMWTRLRLEAHLSHETCGPRYHTHSDLN